MGRIKKALSNRWGAYTIAAIAGVVAYMILNNLPAVSAWLSSAMSVISPIIIGAIIAYLIDLLVVFFDTKAFKKIQQPKFRYALSVVVSITVVLLALGLFFWLVLPEMISSITHFMNNTQNYATNIEDKLKDLDKFAENYGIHLNTTNWTANLKEQAEVMISDVSHNLNMAMDILRGVWNVALNIFIGLILSVYFIAGKKRLFRGIDKLRRAMLTDEQYKKHTDFLKRSNAIFSKYISFTILEAIGVGIANAIFMLIAGLPNVVLISVLVGFTNILPTFGPIVGCVMGSFVLVLEDPMYAVAFIIFTCILQTIDGYVVKPHLFGDSLGIPAVISLISIIIGGKLFGPIGILISIPFTAVMAILYHESLLPYLEKRKKMRMAEDAKLRKKAVAAEGPSEIPDASSEAPTVSVPMDEAVSSAQTPEAGGSSKKRTKPSTRKNRK
ncbi:MAG: AI-2E family transporter [Clostridiales bacterium]|nr:AI-2E family transporter [Clostridiales bacterium]